MNNGQTPPLPADVNAERALLGSCLMDAQSFAAIEGYTHWNMGGVWYAATAQSPQTTVARGVETEQQAIAECRKHKAEMQRKYSGG